MKINYQPIGDQAIRIEFPKSSSAYIPSILTLLRQKDIYGVTDITPGLTTITVYYQYPQTNYYRLEEILTKLLQNIDIEKATGLLRKVIVPVLYDGPDLKEVADYHQKKVSTIIEEHTQPFYRVAMLGFLPGFPYLTGLSNYLHTPRRQDPRLLVDAGSVGIGGEQTGIYPINSPGGWNIIGKTPLPLFQPESKEPFLFQEGDTVQFISITETEWSSWVKKVNENRNWRKEIISHEND
ncbi:5-oxoprolinase subunit PxpB [Sutcliffiella sp. NC1]|uniref:5-oxoprolinase subunit PxpB n=1 Tax=Sutcliffiella sp. NC1 TaxID=3004096 RepID=UPI0022DE321C|nr:5-oxoprolinase subunit PxpB [Sutcliffiella sp. NC1]WBL15008.1 5-oxoprolinase subunit PxpB [Sutcliffiella sp. NC1]